MKKIFYIFVIAAICMALILPAAATEIEIGSVAIEETLAASEGAGSEEDGEEITEDLDSVSEALTETAIESVIESTTDAEIESEDVAAIINGADSKIEIIVGLAGAMGITIEEAEELLGKMVALGDEHLGETDIWKDIKASIQENPETWTIVAFVLLILAAFAVFLIRGQIKNTSAQAATKANIIDIKETEAETHKTLLSASAKLTEIEIGYEGIKVEMGEIHNTVDSMLKTAAESRADLEKILEMVAQMLAEVDALKGNSEAALTVNKEQAFQTVQLLNIALGRTPLNVSDATRKAWYEHSVARIKAAADAANEDKSKASAPAEQ